VSCAERLPDVADRPANDDRAALRRAIAEREAAKEELREAIAAVERAETFLAAVKHDTEKVAALSAAAAERSAAAISRGEAPADSVDDLAKARAVNAERHEHMTATIRSLTAQRDAAQAAIDRAKVKVNAEIEKLVTSRAIAEAAELDEVWADAWRRYDRLAAFAELRFPRPNNSPNPSAPFASSLQLISLPGDTVRLIQTIQGVDHRWGYSTGKERSAARLDQWRKGLLENADSEL
jgi:hypothetical protein